MTVPETVGVGDGVLGAGAVVVGEAGLPAETAGAGDGVLAAGAVVVGEAGLPAETAGVGGAGPGLPGLGVGTLSGGRAADAGGLV